MDQDILAEIDKDIAYLKNEINDTMTRDEVHNENIALIRDIIQESDNRYQGRREIILEDLDDYENSLRAIMQ